MPKLELIKGFGPLAEHRNDHGDDHERLLKQMLTKLLARDIDATTFCELLNIEQFADAAASMDLKTKAAQTLGNRRSDLIPVWDELCVYGKMVLVFALALKTNSDNSKERGGFS